MKNSVLTSLALCTLLGCSTIPAQDPAQPVQWELVWEDHFEGDTLNPDHWVFQWGGKMHGVGRLNPKAVSVDGAGHLKIETFMGEGGELQTGRISTFKKFEQQYGRFSARMKMQHLKGHHSGFWLVSPTYGKVDQDLTASGTEIDVVEYFGDDSWKGGIIHNVHWNHKTSPNKQSREYKWMMDYPKPFIPSDDFHEYTVDWNPDGYVFYVDGIETYRLNEGVSHHPHYIVFSLLSSAFERDRMDESKLPDGILVDWVKAYKRTP